MSELEQHTIDQRRYIDTLSASSTLLPTRLSKTASTACYQLPTRSDVDDDAIELEPPKYASSSNLNEKFYNNGQYQLLPGWPQRPHQLNSLLSRVKHALADFVMAGIALHWLVYGAYVYNADGAVVREKETKLFEAGNIGTTIFPYVFAATLGRFLHVLARWRLEFGASLKTIDQLFTSTTLFHTVKTIFRLRTVNLINLALLVVWSLSPVGSQATLRVRSLRTRTENSTAPLAWMDTSTNYRWLGPDNPAMNISVAAVQSSAMMASQKIKMAASDGWDNVKVPILERLSVPIDTNWTALPDDSPTVYSSLVGIPAAGSSQLASNTYQFNASYWYASCSDLSYTPTSVPVSTLLTNFSSSDYRVFNANNHLWQLAISTRKTNDTTQPPLPFVFEVLGQDDQGQYLLAHMKCNLTTSIVDLQTSCNSKSICGVTAMRYSATHKPNTFTPPIGLGMSSDPEQTTLSRVFTNFVQSFPASYAGPGGSAVFERYLSTGIQIDFAHHSPYATIGNRTASNFGMRLTQLLNTHWLISTGTRSIEDGLNSTAKPSYEINDYSPQVIHSERTVYFEVQYLHCEKTWLALLVLASGSLFLVSIASGILRLFLKGPDVLDIVSAITMPNSVRAPMNASFMDGAERSRLLGDKRIRLGDGAPNDVWGKIVVGDECRVQGFQEAKYYS